MFRVFIGKKLLVLAALLSLVTQTAAVPGAGPDPIDNMLRFEELVVYKYEGNQPYDVVARLVDGSGNPATGADVQVVFAALGKWPIPLKEMKAGTYIGCDIDTVDVPAGELLVRVTAEKKGYNSIFESTSDQYGNACGAGEPQIYASKVEASKPNGAKQPLDVFVYLEDESGRPVKERVMARATDFDHHVDALLKDMGGGRYLACGLGNFSTSGQGQISIHLSASASGFRSTEAETVNNVGSICGRETPDPTKSDPPGTHAVPDPTSDDTPATSRGDGRYAR